MIRLLARLGNTEVLAYLAPLVESADAMLCEFAAFHIAAAGRCESIELLRSAVERDTDIREAITSGTSDAIDGRRAAPAFLHRVAGLLAPYSDTPGVRACLKRLEPFALRPDNRRLPHVLFDAHLHDALIEPELLWPLLDAAKAQRDSRVHGLVLRLLAHTQDERIDREIDDAIGSDDATLYDDAAHALLCARGLPDPNDVLCAIIDEPGRSTSTAETHVAAIDLLICEVNNGGFWDYFSVPEREHWRLVLDAARAIGAANVRSIVQRAVAAFGPDGPAASATARAAQMDQLARILHEVRRSPVGSPGRTETSSGSLEERSVTERTGAPSRSCERSGEPMAYSSIRRGSNGRSHGRIGRRTADVMQFPG